MATIVITSSWVQDFIRGLELKDQFEVNDVVLLLIAKGHSLSMPDAKPIGKGLWELRIAASTAIRILYGFCGGKAILLVAFSKQQNAIPQHEFKLALKRLKEYCM